MGKYYEDELIPTSAQQVDRAYPEWAMSTARLKIHAAKAIATSARRTRASLESLIQKLETEGPEPCYEAALAAHKDRHHQGKTLLFKEAYGG